MRTNIKRRIKLVFMTAGENFCSISNKYVKGEHRNVEHEHALNIITLNCKKILLHSHQIGFRSCVQPYFCIQRKREIKIILLKPRIYIRLLS